jgi:hypothetical protein
MRILLGSGGFRTEERVRFLAEQMREFFGNIGRVLFVPYALQDPDRPITPDRPPRHRPKARPAAGT